MYSQHKAWMDYEFRVAHRFKVPVIAISLEHQEKFPQEIIKQCDNLIVWNRKKICSTLRDMLDRKQLIQSHIIAKNY